MGEDKICFVIGPIGEPGSETRKRSDQLVKHIVARVVEPRGYKTLRADQIPEPGMITPQIIDRVRDSDLVVADLAGRNPNVFYELAIRHAEKKPLIQIMARGEDIPFDVRDMRTIVLDIHDLDSVDAARRELTDQVEAIEKGDFEMNTPISVALDLRALRESGDPWQRTAGEVLAAIAELKGIVVSQHRTMGQRELQALQGEYLRRVVRERARPSTSPDIEDMPEWLRNLREQTLSEQALREQALREEVADLRGAPDPDA